MLPDGTIDPGFPVSSLDNFIVNDTARDIARPSQATEPMASKGLDYTAIAGRLTWADGDDGDRQVVVPIASDTQAEPPEYFELALESPEGGAGLGGVRDDD